MTKNWPASVPGPVRLGLEKGPDSLAESPAPQPPSEPPSGWPGASGKSHFLSTLLTHCTVVLERSAASWENPGEAVLVGASSSPSPGSRVTPGKGTGRASSPTEPA